MVVYGDLDLVSPLASRVDRRGKRKIGAVLSILAIACATAVVYSATDPTPSILDSALAEGHPITLLDQDADKLQDAARLKHAAWLSHVYDSRPEVKGLSFAAADQIKAKLIVHDFVKALEDESKKEQVNRTLRTVAGQSLQADPTPTYFNDPFMDNGGFFGVCKQGCTHGEAHEACVNAGAELASIHSADDNIEATKTCEGVGAAQGTFIGEYWKKLNQIQLPDFTSDIIGQPFATTESTGISYDTADFNFLRLPGNEHFAARWRGQIAIVQEGSYTFKTSSDDGSQLFVGSKMIVNNDGLHGTEAKTGSIDLKPGYYPLKVTFFQRGGGAVVTAEYAGPDTAGEYKPVTAPVPTCYFGLERDGATLPWKNSDKSKADFHNWQDGLGGPGGDFVFASISPTTGLWTDGRRGSQKLPAVCRKPPCHYLYYRGVPCPPDDYQAPLGASPQTWPQIYKNLVNVDYCVGHYKHLGNRILCMKTFHPSTFLP